MAFRPLLRGEPKPMDARLFRPEPMGLDEILLERPLSERLALDAEAGVLYIDLDGYRARTEREVEAVREAVAARVEPLGRKVNAVISYDSCVIEPEMADAWFAMAADVESRFYTPRLALHDERLHAPEARRRAVQAGGRAPYLRDPPRGPRLRGVPNGAGLMALSNEPSHRAGDASREASGDLQPDRSGHVLGLSMSGFHEIAYVEWGPADAEHVVVCVHGLTRQGRDFDHLAAHLAALGVRVVCPDLVGRGRSGWLRDPKDYTIPQYCSDMNALIARTGAARVDWVGTSLGGLIGLGLAGFPAIRSAAS